MNLAFRTKLKLMIGGFSLFALFAFATIAIRSHLQLDNEKSTLSEAAVEGLIDKIDRNLFERYGDVQAFAVSEPARSMDSNRIVSFMNDMMPTYAPIYDVMMVTDTKGKVLAVNTVDKNGKELNTSSLLGKDYSESEWFKKAINNEIKAGTAFIEDLHLDNDVGTVAQTDGKVMSFTTPIVDKKTGKIVGVWSNRVSWKDVVENIFKEELQKITKGRIDQIFPYLLSTNGTFLVHPESDKVFKKAEGWDFKPGVSKMEQNLEKFKGSVFHSTAESKGYSIYPGIGWKAVLEVPVSDSARTFNLILAASVALLLVLFNIFLFSFTSKSSATLEKVLDNLTERFKSINNICKEFSTNSARLAEATTEQAAAIEETVASMEEMTSMISQTASNTSQSMDVANQGVEQANSGRSVISKMTSSMNEIQSSNSQLQEIVKLIEEIQNKTKVINDIVFETRLLAFNASIEAARAGAHGKGFAVVAEEVGKLASMSGKAADEIRNLLETSTARVNKVVTTTSEKVSAGQQISSECESAFNSVGAYLEKIGGAVRSIASATKEQETGVRQTNKAMQEMDKTTQSTAQSADFMDRQSQLLSQNAEELQKNISVLESFIYGANKSETKNISDVENHKNSVIESTFTETKSTFNSSKPSTPTMVQRTSNSSLTEKTLPEAPTVASTPKGVERSDSRWVKVA